jgi:hypothetical protein
VKAKIDEPGTNSKIKNIRDLYRDIIDFEEGYQLITNIIKDEKGDLVTDFHSILAKWRPHFSHLSNLQVMDKILETLDTIGIKMFVWLH